MYSTMGFMQGPNLVHLLSRYNKALSLGSRVAVENLSVCLPMPALANLSLKRARCCISFRICHQDRWSTLNVLHSGRWMIEECPSSCFTLCPYCWLQHGPDSLKVASTRLDHCMYSHSWCRTKGPTKPLRAVESCVASCSVHWDREQLDPRRCMKKTRLLDQHRTTTAARRIEDFGAFFGFVLRPRCGSIQRQQKILHQRGCMKQSPLLAQDPEYSTRVCQPCHKRNCHATCIWAELSSLLRCQRVVLLKRVTQLPPIRC